MEQGRARGAAEHPERWPRTTGRVPEQARGEHTHGTHPQDAHPQDADPHDAHPQDADPRDAQPQDAHPGDARPQDAHPHDRPAPAGTTAGGPAPGASRLVQRHSVRGQVLDALRAALVGGELAPGVVYSAPALGLRLGVSATPVREAMQQLAVEGAVEVVPNRGFRVVERTPRELRELAEVRALIEVPVMLRLARTLPAEGWAQLRPLAEATAAAAAHGDLATYAEADRAFHRALLGLAGNEQLVAVADDLHRRSQWPLVSPPATRRADLVADAAEHGALLDALAAGDLTVVESLVREHFTGSGN
ncbi:FCD domain-containing protein [Streptomyces kanasensis]|uniref:GntR family transcriptional regulator n=1 Tax=Streptomyces kanasensis TaxID=936756 RepID=UPI0036FAB54E